MYKLYWCRQTAALAPELVLEEGGIAYEKITIDISRLENFRLDYLAVNPAGFVPTLVAEGGVVITETLAIVLWLCEQHALPMQPEPGDPDRAEYLRWLTFLANVIQTTYKRYYFPQRFSTDEGAASGIKARALAMQGDHWKLLDDHLKIAGPFVLGERFSAADLYLAMLLTWYPDPKGLAARLPSVGRCYQAVRERPIAGRVLSEHGDVTF